MATVEVLLARIKKAASSVQVNLLISTTYALNKSNSKRAIVGLQRVGGLFKPVVKFCGSGSPVKYVTFDTEEWELFNKEMDQVEGYLHKGYNCPVKDELSKISLGRHDVIFTTAYDERAIVIDERPATPSNPELGLESQDMLPPPSYEECQRNGESHSKRKKKHEAQPSIVMQDTTCSGLLSVVQCINERLQQLEEYSGYINRGYQTIIDFLRDELKKEEDAEKMKTILSNVAAFKNYYVLRKVDIENRVVNELEFASSFNKHIINTVLLEIEAFCSIMLMNDLYDLIFTSS